MTEEEKHFPYCMHCAFVAMIQGENTGARFECHRFPPQVGLVHRDGEFVNHHSFWPPVGFSDTCGEFKTSVNFPNGLLENPQTP